MRGGWLVTGAMAGLLAVGGPARAYDPRQTFVEGSVVVSIEGAYGEQFNAETHRTVSDLRFWDLGVRVSLLPLGPTGSGPLWGALEVGLEPIYQRYTSPVQAFFAGLAGVVRYHFLSLGRFVPYAEAGGGAGGTDLRADEIDSDFAILLLGGVGASLFVTARSALYAGYRFQHISNGNTDPRNRGFESHVGVAGVSFFFE